MFISEQNVMWIAMGCSLQITQRADHFQSFWVILPEIVMNFLKTKQNKKKLAYLVIYTQC